MTFIQVTDLRLDFERGEQPPAADPEHSSCLRRSSGPPIEFAGDPSMRGKIRRVIAVQEVKLDSTDLDLPGAQPHRVTRQGDLQPQPLAVRAGARRDRQLAGVVIREGACLRSVLVDHLAKIALLVEQPHANHRHAQIAGSFELIAGHITKSA